MYTVILFLILQFSKMSIFTLHMETCFVFNLSQNQKILDLKNHPTLQRDFCNQFKPCSGSRNFLLKLLYRYYICNNVYSNASVYLGPEIYAFPGQGLPGVSHHRRSTLVAFLKTYRLN